ncbi:2OG-Fe dioxygenase family protein [Mycobacterium simiae]|uniref:2OG-Fe dioxygenase family protein n=1 Tax=Mycobacterium simiae TaxID=1784 RepID=UPI00165F5C0F
MPDELFDSTLRILLGAVADMVKKAAPSVVCMNIVVHHTLVQRYPGQVCTNSPEGIHQDGMDFIVSTLVVQQENITGEKSIVYRGKKLLHGHAYRFRKGAIGRRGHFSSRPRNRSLARSHSDQSNGRQ